MADYDLVDPIQYMQAYENIPREMYSRKHWEPIIDCYIKKYCNQKDVLDLGCGYGKNTPIILKYATRVFGLDISSRWLTYLKGTLIFPHLILGDAHMVPLKDGSVDVVVSTGLFEYVSKERTLKEIRRVLKPDGYCIISVPNKYGTLRFPLRLGYAILRKKYTPDEPSKSDMITLFENYGFELIDYKMDDGLIYLPDAIDFIIGMKIYCGIERFFRLFKENPLSNGMLFVVKKVAT